MNRIVQPELLDSLPPGNPCAVRSRRDLRRVNAWMRHHAIMAYALEKIWSSQGPVHLTELGAGDGNFLLRVAQKLKPASSDLTASGVTVTLLDQKNNISVETLAGFYALGWRAETVVADVFDWPQHDGGIFIANLFLHHFKNARLVELLRLISQRADIFIALEPLRASWPLFCSRLLWAIGCNDVTRHDAVVSVQAGFCEGELSKFWPDKEGWMLSDQSVGMFSQLFIAQKRGAGRSTEIHSAGKMPAAR